MKFGIAFANIVTFTQHEGLVTLAQSAEAAGFESLWTIEHVIYPEGYESQYPYDPSGKMMAYASTPMPDPLIWLAFVAAATTELRLGTGILILPQRNPVILAKELATRASVDAWLSQMRASFDRTSGSRPAISSVPSGRRRRVIAPPQRPSSRT